ncbi:MAG: DnaK suppressor [Geobacteraceae bacterium]|nr:MAG: DnaK suppressor [Geobacteraceae bacterium]
MSSKKDRYTKLKEMLQDQKRRRWNELREELFRTVGEELHSQVEIPQDVGDQGLVDLLEDMGLNIADIRRQELSMMDEAVGKLERGTYGVCEECGNEINEERLKVIPFALYCVDCQKRREGPPYPPGAKL